MTTEQPYRYMVTLSPNVSIGPKRFVRVVEVPGPRPFEALTKAIELFNQTETNVWMSDDVDISIERVA